MAKERTYFPLAEKFLITQVLLSMDYGESRSFRLKDFSAKDTFSLCPGSF
jgi:hypothetical protein